MSNRWRKLGGAAMTCPTCGQQPDWVDGHPVLLYRHPGGGGHPALAITRRAVGKPKWDKVREHLAKTCPQQPSGHARPAPREPQPYSPFHAYFRRNP